MASVNVGLAMRNRLGEEGVRDLDEYMNRQREEWRADMVNAITARLEPRFAAIEFRCATRDDIGRLEKQISDVKIEILRWSFAFWIGQCATIVGFLSFMLRR